MTSTQDTTTEYEQVVDTARSLVDSIDAGTTTATPETVALIDALIARGQAINEAASLDDHMADPARVELSTRASLGRFIDAVSRGETVNDGPEAELSQEVFAGQALPPTNGLWVPTELLATRQAQDWVTRADTATTTTQHDGHLVTQPIIGRVFNSPASQALGLSTSPVAMGRVEFPVITGGAAPAMTAEGTAAEADAATFEVSTLKPLRLPARYVYSVEARMQAGQDLDDALRRDLRDSLAAKMEDEVLNGAGTGAEPEGVIAALTAPANPTSVITGPQIAGQAGALVDGKYASREGEVRLLVPPAAYSHSMSLMTTTGDAAAAGQSLAARAGGYSTSAHVPAPSSNIATVLARLGAMTSDYAWPVWSGMSVVDDPYSGAASGTHAVTVTVLWNFKVLRSDGFAYAKWKLA